MATVAEIFPAFSRELIRLVLASARPELSVQIATLPLVERCRCGEAGCAHFYTAAPPLGAYGPGHGNVLLNPEIGMIVLDTVEDHIVGIEVLDRPDVKRVLDAVLP